MPASDMNLTKPTVGGSSGTWGTTTNNNTDLIGEHDHTSGKGVKVPSGGINIDAALEFNAKDATELGRVAFDSSVTTSNLVRSLFVDANGDLNYRNENGVDVQITENNTLDAGSLGGITGDYAAGNASLYYDNTGKLYRMLQSAPLPNVWAGVDCGGLKLYEKASGIANGITIQSPTSLAAAYSLTLPTALPGSTSLVTCTSAGVLATSTAPSLTGLTLTGAATSSSTMTVTDLKLSSIRTMKLHVSGAGHLNTGVAFNATGGNITLGTANTDASIAWSVPLNAGDRIREVRIYINKTSAAGTITGRLRHVVLTTGSAINDAVDTEAATTPLFTSLAMTGLSITIAAVEAYYVIVQGGGTTGDTVYGAEVDWDRP